MLAMRTLQVGGGTTSHRRYSSISYYSNPAGAPGAITYARVTMHAVRTSPFPSYEERYAPQSYGGSTIRFSESDSLILIVG